MRHRLKSGSKWAGDRLSSRCLLGHRLPSPVHVRTPHRHPPGQPMRSDSPALLFLWERGGKNPPSAVHLALPDHDHVRLPLSFCLDLVSSTS